MTVSAEPFIKTLGQLDNVHIVTAAVAYDCPSTFNTYILFFPQSLYFPTLDKHLLCPNQMRDYQVVVHDTPLTYMLPDQRSPELHSILVNDPALHIPLQLKGTTSCFPVRKPTLEEVQSDIDCIHVHMTSDSPWDPYDPTRATDEDAIRRSLESMPRDRGRMLHSISSRTRSTSPVSLLDFDKAIATRNVNLTHTKTRPGFVTPKVLAKRWGISLKAAEKTIQRTTQRAVRDFTNATGTRRLKPYAMQLRYKRLDCDIYSDIFYGPCVSLLGNKYATLFATPYHWTHFYPMREKSDAHYGLDDLFRKHGVPTRIIPDNAKELMLGEFKKKAQRAQTVLKPIEAYTPNQNFAEGDVRECKRAFGRVMRRTKTPKVLWDLCLVWIGLIRSHTALNIHSLHGDTPTNKLTGETSDISLLAEFGWFDWIWYLGPEEGLERKFLGRWCGPNMDVGSDGLCSWILTSKGTLLSRSSVFPLSKEDNNSEVIDDRKRQYMSSLEATLRDGFQTLPASPEWDESEAASGDLPSTSPIDEETPVDEPYEPLLPDDFVQTPLAEADEVQHEAFDRYISARVFIPQGDQKSFGTVRKRKRDEEGNLIGRSHSNPLLDTSLYEVEFDSGETEAYSANLIAENLYAQVDDDGYTTYAIDAIVDHRKDDNVLKADEAYEIARHGRRRPKRTTKGWHLCVQWQDQSTSWIPLKELKEANPIELAEYAVEHNIDHEPAFAWWVPYTLKKRDRIVKAIKKRYFRRDQKFGIELPKTVKRALEIDRETGTTFWADAIKKEMTNVAVAFEVIDDDIVLVGYTKINCHMIFDVKPGDFSRKARLVAGGHMTDPPSDITYASVVSRESVRIAFLLAALNDLDVQAADIGNAYLNAPVREKIWIVCGPEFGPLEGRRAKVVRALYGLKSSGAAWRSHLAKVLEHELGFTPCRADNDVWMRPAVKADGTKYYEYILVYTDDILCLSMKPDELLTHLDQHFLLKPDSIGPPTRYLGASVKKWKIDGDTCWSMGSEQYAKEAIRNVKNWLELRGRTLKTKAPSVLPTNYRPELDATPLLDDPDDISYYHQQIGVLRWAVELGRIDICAEVSMMASYCAAPREGHMEALCHLYSYLNQHERSHLVFDPSYVQHQTAPTPDWSDFYRDYKEAIPSDMPEPRGKTVQMTTFVDSDHAGDTVTRRSRTGVLVFLNRSPIVWHSKKQNSIETSSFGSEFTAMKTGVEISEGLRYKLRMMGVPLDGPTFVKADNMSVIHNSSMPESQLKKKSNSIAYHYVRERAAAGVIAVSYEPTKTNLADMLTKIQSGPERQRLASQVLF